LFHRSVSTKCIDHVCNLLPPTAHRAIISIANNTQTVQCIYKKKKHTYVGFSPVYFSKFFASILISSYDHSFLFFCSSIFCLSSIFFFASISFFLSLSAFSISANRWHSVRSAFVAPLNSAALIPASLLDGLTLSTIAWSFVCLLLFVFNTSNRYSAK